MRVIRPLSGDAAPGPTALTLGNFDGVHRGHQALLGAVRELAERLGVMPAVALFEPQPQEFFAPAEAPRRLYPLREKLATLRALGLPLVAVLPFRATLAAMEPAPFVRQLLLRQLQARGLLIGDDWRFGRGRAGDYALLQGLQREHGFALQRADTVAAAGERISSTRVRAALAAGDAAQAAALLGRDYALRGRVVHGAKRGRELGFPTANVRLRHAPPLCHGVWACWLDDAPAVANYGLRPSVDGLVESLEVHQLQGAPDLYNRWVRVRFGAHLRPEQRFDGLDALAAQIRRDAEQARQWHRTHTSSAPD